MPPHVQPSERARRVQACLATIPFLLIPVGAIPVLGLAAWLFLAPPAGEVTGVLFLFAAGSAAICALVGMLGLVGAAVVLLAIPETRTGPRLAVFWAGLATAVLAARVLRH